MLQCRGVDPRRTPVWLANELVPTMFQHFHRTEQSAYSKARTHIMRFTSGLSPFRARPDRCAYRRLFATASSIPQTIIEKVVQKYAVDVPNGKVVRAGDYVMIRPEHVMTHDNTGPVISKYACLSSPSLRLTSYARRQLYFLGLIFSTPGSNP